MWQHIRRIVLSKNIEAGGRRQKTQRKEMSCWAFVASGKSFGDPKIEAARRVDIVGLLETSIETGSRGALEELQPRSAASRINLPRSSPAKGSIKRGRNVSALNAEGRLDCG